MPEDRANIVSGRIVLAESGAGIADLVVTATDIGTDGGVELRAGLDEAHERRLGTVLTGHDGQFELRWDDADGPSERRPWLALTVAAPDEHGSTGESRILYSSPEPRRNAGRVEQFVVRIAADRLESAGVPVPVPADPTAEDPGTVLERLNEAETAGAVFRTGLRELKTRRVERRRERTERFEATVKPGLAKALSNVPQELADSPAFVPAGEDAAARSMERIREGIRTVINVPSHPAVRAPVRGVIRLTEELVDELRAGGFENAEGDFVDVPAEMVEPALFGRGGRRDRRTVLMAADPYLRLCRDEVEGERCLERENDEEDDEEEEDEDGDDVELLADGEEPPLEEIPVYVARLLDGLTAPDLPVPGSPGRPDQATVQEKIDSFLLRSGPADTPAFYDFHNLQIAFEHVWQEAIDEGVLDFAEDAYNEIVELGGDPCTSPFDTVPGAVVDMIGCFRREYETLRQALLQEPPAVVVMIFEATREQWTVLNDELRERLELLAAGLAGDRRPGVMFPGNREARNRFQRQGENILTYADSLLSDAEEPFENLHRILTELEQRIREPYAFTVYGASRQRRSVNFGILITYRQRWEPTTYQTGELVRTLTLTPKESRKFSRRLVTKRSRARKEADSALASRREESGVTSRAEAEIVRNAVNKTNFRLTSEGTYNIEIAKGKSTTAFGGDASKTSNEVKKEFREAVFKAAQEYRDERKVEVSTEETVEEEFVESGEIVNPNDELPVTFLFYELQRRYKVSERMHRALPVVLVAQEVPPPHQIDDEWLIAHDWILRRFLLDDSFVPALNYLATHVVGDEYSLREMRKNVDQQRRLVDELKEEVVAYRELVGQRYAALERAIERSAQAAEEESGGGLFGPVGDLVPGGRLVEKGLDVLTGGGDESPEAAQIRERAARDAYEKAMQDERDWLARLNREVTALNAISEAYTKALSDHLNRRTQISRLRAHIKQNILYYMQAIWLMEPDDQRYFRLHKVPVPIFESTAKRYTIRGRPDFARPFEALTGRFPHPYEVDVEIEPDFETAPLSEVADLDNLLGFKGNYMLFPLRRSNALTDFMLAPYIDQEWELYDPDEVGSMTLDEFSQYVCCLRDKLTDDEFAAIRPQLRRLLRELLTSPLRDNEEIVVPTDSLYIEALPGAYPLLEDFKLLHRSIDVRKVQAELRGEELDNVRAAARILAGELDDPDIESVKQVFVSGADVEPGIDVGDDT